MHTWMCLIPRRNSTWTLWHCFFYITHCVLFVEMLARRQSSVFVANSKQDQKPINTVLLWRIKKQRLCSLGTVENNRKCFIPENVWSHMYFLQKIIGTHVLFFYLYSSSRGCWTGSWATCLRWVAQATKFQSTSPTPSSVSTAALIQTQILIKCNVLKCEVVLQKWHIQSICVRGCEVML